MKKFISFLAVLTMMLAMCTTAFAAAKSPTADELVIAYSTSSEAPSDAEIGEGNKLLGVYDASLVHTNGQPATAEEVAAYFTAKGGSITLDFSEYVGSDVSPVKVLHLTGGAWKSESFSGAKVTVSSLSPFAFVVKADAASTKAAAAKSPQTGYNTALWAMSAAMMALCAGYCFVSARQIGRAHV